MGKRQRRRVRLQEAAAVQEAVRGNLVPVDEARLRADGTVPVCIITPGWGSSGYYSAEVLEAAADAGIWPAGTQMFADHPTLTERADRPERSIRDLAAVLETGARWDPNGSEGPGLYGQARIFEAWQPILAELAPHIGISVRAAAEVTTGVAAGRRGRIIENIVEGGSVDFVTRAGRGGKVLAILEAARVGEAAQWADDVRQALRDALQARFGEADGERYVWVRDHNDDDVVFEISGAGDESGTFQIGYTLDADGTATLAEDDPVKVVVQTTYTPVDEARNIGQWIESHMHRSFTVMCDDMAAEGRLTREERIALSSAIGDALGVFVDAVGTTAPQLYQRDLFEEAPTTTVTESEEDTLDTKQIDEAVAKALDAKITEALAPIQEANEKLSTQLTETTAENGRLRTGMLIRDARERVTTELAETKYDALAAAKSKIVEAVCANPAVSADGALDLPKLYESFLGEVQSWVGVISAATGSPVRGVGGSTEPVSEADAEKAAATQTRLEEAFGRLGASDEVAKHAAAGRAR